MIDWRLHTITYSEVDANGFIGIQFDAFGEQDSGMDTVEVIHPFGLMANPPEPDANGAFSCSALIGWEGDQAYAWLCSDPRSRVVLPSLKKGETLLYGCAGNFVRMHADGRISLFTTDDNTPNGKTVALQIKPDGLLFSAPWGKFTFDETGFHVLHVSGAALDLGAIGGLPAPLSALSSYVKLTGNMVLTEGSIVSTGTTDPASVALASAVAKSDPLVAALGDIATGLAGIATAMTAVAGAIPGPSASVATGAASTLATAIGALVTTLGTLAGLVPSSASSVT
ncbi:MAG: hypothetical protein ABW061_18730 [Polyangiaceae bacterium]